MLHSSWWFLLLSKHRDVSSTIFIHVIFNLDTSCWPSSILSRQSIITSSRGSYIIRFLELIQLLWNFDVLSIAWSHIILLNFFIARIILGHYHYIFIPSIPSVLLTFHKRHLSVILLHNLTLIHSILIVYSVHPVFIYLVLRY